MEVIGYWTMGRFAMLKHRFSQIKLKWKMVALKRCALANFSGFTVL